MAKVVPCNAAHTPFQPTNEQWRCPRCQANNDHFVIESSPEDAHELCPLLHKADEVTCTSCDSNWSGTQVAKLLAKIHDVEPCPHCKGIGQIPRQTTNESKPAK